MIDPKAVEELRTQIADAEEHDDPAVSITFGCARALLTALQARDEIVEECAKKIEEQICKYERDSWAHAALESAAFHIRSTKSTTGDKDG
jgi:hypothetical protein